MSCLESNDLIAYPGSRHSEMFTAPDGATFRTRLANALSIAGWTIDTRARSTGPNPGTGFTALSQQVPWCFTTTAPAEYVAKCKVWFCPKTTFSAADVQQTEFYVMNEAETLVQSTTSVSLRATTGSYTDYKYFFIGNPYQFTVFMLGVNKRITDAVLSTNTALMAGVPQIPRFLQTSGTWCTHGINELFFLWQMDSARHGPLYRGGGDYYAAGIDSVPSGSYMNNNHGTGYSPMLHSGCEGGEVFFTGLDMNTGLWVDTGNPTDPTLWAGLFFPPIISWQSDPADVATVKMKGFLWDSVIVNKGYSADDLLSFDGHTFIVFNTWAGEGNPYRPPSALLLAITGAV